MVKIFLLLASINFADSLPVQDSLFSSLRRFHIEKLNSDLAEFQILEQPKKGEWLKWLPEIGLRYTITENAKGQYVDQLRPTIGYNFGQIYLNLKEKERINIEHNLRKAKIDKILRGNILAFKTDSFALIEKLKTLDIHHRAMIVIESTLNIQNELFEEQKKRYEDGLIKPVDWIALRIENAKISEPYYRKLETIDLLILEIYRLARL